MEMVRRSTLRLPVTLLLLVLLGSAVQAQTPFYFSVDAFPDDQEIFALAQDAHGRMIISTGRGIYRFNGYKSKEIPVNGVKGDPIIEFVSFREQLIGLTKTGRLLHYKADKWELWSVSGLSENLQHIELQGEKLLANSRSTVFVIDLEKRVIDEQLAIPFTDKKVKANAVTAYKGVAYALLNSGEIVDVRKESAWSLPNNRGRQLIAFEDELFILPEQLKFETVYRFNGSDFRFLGSLSTRESVFIRKGELLGGQLYITSSAGVYVFPKARSSKAQYWNFGTPVNDVYQDAVGNTWLATAGKGLLLVPAGKHQLMYNQPAAAISGSGNIYFTDVYGKIFSLGKSGLDVVGQLASNEGNWLHVDEESGVYITEHGIPGPNKSYLYVDENLKSVFRLKNGQWVQATGTAVHLFPSMPFEMWIKPQQRTKRTTVLSSESILQVHPNTSRTAFLVAASDGLYWINDSLQKLEVTHFKKRMNVLQICSLKDSWIVLTSDNVLHEIKDGRVVRSRNLGGKSQDVVCRKLLSDGDWLYYLTDKGVYRAKGLNEPVQSLSSVMGFDGLSIQDFTVQKDQIYLVTPRGVLRYLWQVAITSDVHLVMGRVTGSQPIESENSEIVFQAGERLVVVPVEVVDLNNNHRFVLQYRLFKKGETGFWNTISTQTERISFPHLDAGDYVVEVRLFDPYSGVQTAMNAQSFLIEKSWWEHTWLHVLAGVLLGAGLMIVGRRIKTMKQDKAVLNK